MAATIVQQNITMPAPPEFPTLAEERQHRKQRLAAAFRLFARYGFDEGVAGHITARDPELLDHFWVNPFGMHFAHIRVSDLLLVNERGDVVSGNQLVNRAAFAIHSRVHAHRPDVIGAAHAHSLYGKTWSTLGRLLDPITQDACAFYQDHSVFSSYGGLVSETDEADRIAAALGNSKAAILQNHGLLTVGRTVDEAAWWFITMDRSCQAQIVAEQVGPPIKIPHETALHTREVVGSHISGWFQFQPLYQWIVRLEPDLLQ